MNRADQPSDVRNLIEQAIDGVLPEEQLAELTAALVSDPQQLAELVNSSFLHAQLHELASHRRSLDDCLAIVEKAVKEQKAVSHQPLATKEDREQKTEDRAQPVALSSPLTRHPTSRSKSWLNRASRHPLVPSIAVAVAVMVAVLLGMGVTPVKEWIAGGDNKNDLKPATEPEFVARLNNWHDDIWLEDTRPPLRDPRLTVGRRLVLASGVIEIKYNTGARVVIEGPAEFYVGTKAAGKKAQRHRGTNAQRKEEANSGYLKYGNLVARVEGDDAQGFTIDTPMGEIEDLGTEFGVRVTPGGRTQLHVFEGKVRMQSSTETGRRTAIVTTGGGLVADSRGLTSVSSTASTASAGRYVRGLAPVRVGIVAAWTFERDFTADVGGAAYDLTAVGGATAGEPGGRFGFAARFDRTSSQYAFTSGNVLRQHKDHSYSAWYKLDVTEISGKNRYFVIETMAGNTPSNTAAWSISYGLRKSHGDIGQVNVRTESGTGPVLDVVGGNGNRGESEWHNIIVTYDADGGGGLGEGRHTVYLDGSLIGTFDSDDPLAAVGGLVIGGHREGKGRNWDGLIDDVAIFDHVLSDGEIQTLQSTSVLADLLDSTTVVDESTDVGDGVSETPPTTETQSNDGGETTP